MVEVQDEGVVEIDSDSELAKVLAGAGKKPVAIISNGRRYIATRDPLDPARDDDSDAFEGALRAVVGTLTPEQGERLKRDMYRWREEGSRPMNQITRSRTADDPVWAMLTPERIDAVTRAVFGSLDSAEGEQAEALGHDGRKQAS